MLNTFFHGFTAVCFTGTLQNLRLNISSTFSHHLPLGQATKKQAQSEAQRASSVYVCVEHAVLAVSADVRQAAFFIADNVPH
jgi:hypothetical protein